MNRPRPITTPPRSIAITLAALMLATGMGACKRSETPPPDLLKTQRDAMDRAKDVGKTMQKAVDREGRKAEEEGK